MTTAVAQQAKYVFYFIGDGMGLNQVNGTESFLAELEGRIGIQKLCFPSFPYSTFATSYSFSNGVTDSAAAGTALATGVKTYNAAIGVGPDSLAVTSIAYLAKQQGKKVGIGTTCSIDHATPASFYAHQKHRDMYYEIGKELPASDFDFFAGADLRQPEKNGGPELHQMIADAGYAVAYGLEEGKAAAKTAKKMFMTQTKEATAEYGNELPYAIDRRPGDLSLKQIVELGIEFLMKDNKKGFFLMAEGGKIDYAGHSDDGGACFREVQDLDEAVKVAFEFYKQHPKETLIVVTADHETGGLGLGNGAYAQNLKVLQHQKASVAQTTKKLAA
ncbi:MAG: alkaline phosphatase, partial [Bacteroidaceae bacterium]|nr:alkaline phosphatase [Bacteroidaceae bacterium]